MYAFDAEGSLLGEVSPEVGKTTWRVHLANKKAAWFTFNGAASADKAFRGEDPETPPRNNHPEFGEIVRIEGQFKSDERRSHLLEIDGREKEISGPNKRKTKRDADSFEFRGVFRGGAADRDGTSVYLGEILTDEEGRLIVLGGSRSIRAHRFGIQRGQIRKATSDHQELDRELRKQRFLARRHERRTCETQQSH